MPPSQSKYCVGTGQSSPSSSKVVDAFLRGLLAENRCRRVARQRLRHGEDDDQDNEQREDAENSNRFRMNLMTPRLFDSLPRHSSK